jgi:hypothetical protein
MCNQIQAQTPFFSFFWFPRITYVWEFEFYLGFPLKKKAKLKFDLLGHEELGFFIAISANS